MPANPFWTTGIPRTPTPKERAIRDLLARMQGKSGLVVGSLKVTQILTIQSTTPELRFKESDQVAPAGEWRWQLSVDSLRLQRAATAAFATVQNIVRFAGGTQRLMAFDEATRIHYDSASIELWHNDGVIYTTDANSNGAAYYFGAKNSASTHTSVAKVSNANNPLGANSPYWEFINQPVHFQVNMYGPSAADWNIIGRATRSIMFQLHNDAGTAVDVLYLPTNNTTPMVGVRAPNITPTTTLLPATFLGFVVDGSDQLTAYWNDAGTIRSLVIGTLL